MIEFALATMIICEQPILTRGYSDEAAYVCIQGEKARKQLRDSYALGWGGEAVFVDLEEIQQECSEEGWDGYNAIPVSSESHEFATAFLKALPIGVPVPSVSADPDGQITLEWYASPRKTVSVSISQEGELHFSALNGSSSTYGTEFFYGKAPRTIIELIQRLKAA